MSKSLYPLLISVYFAQGIPAGLSAHALPVLLREQGVGLSVITLMNALALPWLLKFLWAPWVDTVKHRARIIAWVQIVVALIFVVFTSVSLSAWLSQHVIIFICLLVIINTLMASHDVLTDGLAVRLLDAKQRGFGNVFQVSGYKIGMVIGGSLLLWFISVSSWLYGNIALALILLVLAGVIVFLAKPFAIQLSAYTGTKNLPSAEKVESASFTSALIIWQGFLRQPGILLWLVVVAFYKLGDALASSIVRPMWVDYGFDTALIGGVGAIAVLASLVGAIMGGVLYRYQSAYRCLVFTGILQALGLLGYAYCAWASPSLSVWMVVFNIEQCVDGASTVVLFAAMMAVCRKSYAGSDYTLQASLFLMITGAFKLVSGYLAQSLGYAEFFILAALLFIIPLVVLFQLKYRQWFTWFDAQK